MRSVFHFVLLLTAILVPGVPAAEPPQPSPAPVLGSEDLRWLAERESFRVGVRSGQVPLVFDTGEGSWRASSLLPQSAVREAWCAY